MAVGGTGRGARVRLVDHAPAQTPPPQVMDPSILETLAAQQVAHHLGDRCVPALVVASVRWAVEERLAEGLHPALDAHLAAVLDGAAAEPHAD